ncbi:DUF2242 domain-containing protein [Aquabacterium sp. OR-4]|uniref:DUF2242 domain-containing protein n=1 Tax=Aquabacterium sp. OR-4 TaxID=2978127 RepID=UPI0021B2E071|nr:DUF2242 domain-containing protein [Aquabacterium sp. OR-4]MDT7837847.1 DUF2242 domain-containing protein [Aquabacterium sp. OR-4]
MRQPPRPCRRHRLCQGLRCLALLATAATLAACSTPALLGGAPPLPSFASERFDRSAPFARRFAGQPEALCEAARRALLSQGYMITGHERLGLSGRKFFQPQRDAHVQLAISVSCADEVADAQRGTVYVTAWQDQFVIKRNPSHASVGVSAFGSISLPLSASEDSLVKVGIETISDAAFYERFYGLLGAVLAAGVTAPAATATPSTAPAATATPSAAAAPPSTPAGR